MAFQEGFSGMSDLIRALQRLPEELRTEADGVVDATAALFKAELDQEYGKAQVTGNLLNHTRIEKEAPMRVKVRNRAKHAQLYERGTVQRFTARTGANRGTMPARPTFIPAAIRARHRMVRELTNVVKRAKVAGMSGTMEVRET